MKNKEEQEENILEELPINFRFPQVIKSSDEAVLRVRFFESDFYQTAFATGRKPHKPVSKIFNR